MDTLKHLDTAIEYIKNKGFTHIKVEMEANLARNQHPRGETETCEECAGDGYFECNESHTCDDCGGSGYICSTHGGEMNICEHGTDDDPCSESSCDGCDDGYYDCEHDTNCEECDGRGYNFLEAYDPEDHPALTDDYCNTWVLNQVSPEAREALNFAKVYVDGTVDTEMTFTLPIEYAKYLPEFLKAFRELGDESGTFDCTRAGMHIAVLRSGVYPVPDRDKYRLSLPKLSNFINQMKKLMPALYFLASADHKSRRVYFRQPMVNTTKYSAIHIVRGGFEYRVFEVCYDKPEMILQYVQTIAKTLKYYSGVGIKTPIFKNFQFPEVDDYKPAYLERFFRTADTITALDLGLRYLLPDGVTADEAKAQRNFKPNPNREELILRKRYIAFVAAKREEYESAKKSSIRDQIKLPSRAKQLYEVKLKPGALSELSKQISQDFTYKAPSYADWLGSVRRNNNNDYSIVL